MERFLPLAPEQMTQAQLNVAESIASGPRGSLEGPFKTWLRSPELADRLQKVGEYIRFHSSLPKRLNEFAILIVAREWQASFEWFIHEPAAVAADLASSITGQLRDGNRPDGMRDDETLVYDFCTQLLRQHQVSDAMYEAAVGRFGEQGVVDLIGAVGYYSTVAMTLNVAQVMPPGGEPAIPPPSVPG